MSDDQWLYFNADLSDGTDTAFSSPAVVKGLYVNTILSNHACAIKDGDSSVFTIPAQQSAGTFKDFYNTEFQSSIVIVPNVSATGDITLLYKRLRPI